MAGRVLMAELSGVRVGGPRFGWMDGGNWPSYVLSDRHPALWWLIAKRSQLLYILAKVPRIWLKHVCWIIVCPLSVFISVSFDDRE